MILFSTSVDINYEYPPVCPASCVPVCSEIKWPTTWHEGGAHHIQWSGKHNSVWGLSCFWKKKKKGLLLIMFCLQQIHTGNNTWIWQFPLPLSERCRADWLWISQSDRRKVPHPATSVPDLGRPSETSAGVCAKEHIISFLSFSEISPFLYLLSRLSESGPTALGPAALLAIAAASRRPGSKVDSLFMWGSSH